MSAVIASIVMLAIAWAVIMIGAITLAAIH